MVSFRPGFVLDDGWQYFLTIKRNVKTASGESMVQDKIFEIRTTIRPVGLTGENNRENNLYNRELDTKLHTLFTLFEYTPEEARPPDRT